MLSALAPSPLWAHHLHPDCLAAAYERDGAWEVETHEPRVRTLLGAFRARLFGSSGVTTTRITLTEKEFAKLMDVAKQHLMAEAKEKVLRAAVNMEANGLWRTGSVEHVGLKALAPDMVIRCAVGAQVTDATSVAPLLSAPLLFAAAAYCQPAIARFAVEGLRWLAKRCFEVPFWEKETRSLVMLLEGVYAPETRVVQGWPRPRAPVIMAVCGFGWVGVCLWRSYNEVAQIWTSTYRPSTRRRRAGGGAEAPPQGGEVGVRREPGGAEARDEPAPLPPGPPPPPAPPPAPAILAPPALAILAPPPALAILDREPEDAPAPEVEMREQEQSTVAARVEESEDLVLQEPHGRYRTVEVGGERVHVVLGQDYDKDAPRDRAPRVGALTGPSQKPPNVYSNTKKNIIAAIYHRLELKSKPCKFTAADKRKIGKFVAAAISNKGIFSRKRVEAWFRKHFDITEWRSKKWSLERIVQMIERLLCQVDPEFRLNTAVKAEDMPEGKSPRFLIADGDAGQVMALAAIKCIEDLLFEAFEEHSIKHAGKRDAVARLVGHMRVPSKRRRHGFCFVEGDGSAWDTTCNETVRGLIENPVIAHVGAIIAEMGLVPASWVKAHEKVNQSKKYKLFFKKFHEVLRKEIPAIRRSGHRGTSVLNYWVNFAMWVCSLFEAPEKFLDPEVRSGVDVAGMDRWFFGGFEGDDSGVQTAPRLIAVSDEDRAALRAGQKQASDLAQGDPFITESVVKASAEALDFWDRGGFNMKFVFASRRATMVGMHLHLSNDNGNTEPSGLFCPELPRGIGKNVSCSPAILAAIESGCLREVKKIAAAANLARAADYAGILPTVSNKYKEYADRLDAGNYQDREMAMHVDGEEGVTAVDVRERIELLNSSVTPADEEDRLAKLLYSADEDEMQRFKDYLWDFSNLDDHAGYHASLPAAWRAGGSV
ncbi:RNA-dependent RNA polymerase [Beihai weivirus-like virus 1]|uniref:RNA-dependent RNA polymerase n=1 Tax=Beihai weivirus-like virus 1 TaxID=1922738 RepID=UPI00090A22C1|nr:RNA-dependent RNA polymerase [Beihai weivirus-like virus 1]APG78113.1 RNA-dependent RNA polymerase [Beihai weivirus-like virus 1]